MFFITVLANQIIFFVWLVVPSDVSAVSKIVGGHAISIDKAPYQVWIAFRFIHESKFGEGLFCGGTLISQDAVLSAAHCFHIKYSSPYQYVDAEYFIVIAGCSNLIRPEKYTQEFPVRKIVPHGDFDSYSFLNDIAILFLKGLVPWNSKNVEPIAMAKTPPAIGEICQISGWGSTLQVDMGENLALFPSVLQLAEVPTLNYDECKDIYHEFTTSQICAGYEAGSVDGCQGDSGGPLICSKVLSGVTSFGYGCAMPGIPGVYTDVSYFKDWIDKVNKSREGENSAFYSRKFNLTLILFLLCLISMFNSRLDAQVYKCNNKLSTELNGINQYVCISVICHMFRHLITNLFLIW